MNAAMSVAAMPSIGNYSFGSYSFKKCLSLYISPEKLNKLNLSYLKGLAMAKLAPYAPSTVLKPYGLNTVCSPYAPKTVLNPYNSFSQLMESYTRSRCMKPYSTWREDLDHAIDLLFGDGTKSGNMSKIKAYFCLMLLIGVMTLHYGLASGQTLVDDTVITSGQQTQIEQVQVVEK